MRRSTGFGLMPICTVLRNDLFLQGTDAAPHRAFPAELSEQFTRIRVQQQFVSPPPCPHNATHHHFTTPTKSKAFQPPPAALALFLCLSTSKVEASLGAEIAALNVRQQQQQESNRSQTHWRAKIQKHKDRGRAHQDIPRDIEHRTQNTANN